MENPFTPYLGSESFCCSSIQRNKKLYRLGIRYGFTSVLYLIRTMIFFDNLNFLEGLLLTIAHCDAAEPWQLGFQDAATPMMQGIIDLHHDIFFFLILILVFVLWILVRALWHFHFQKNPIPQRIVHGTTIEILRTIFPSIIPMFIAIPSFALLYSMDEVVVDPAITIKAIGHQWYRTYEYSDYNSSDEQSLTFDSYTIPEDDLELGQSRLLEVDNRVVVPAKTVFRIIVTSADVPHSWAVPSSGVKCDAVPGRLNQISISVQREGVYYGQCSEICGTNHAFTPIVVEAVSGKDYGFRVKNLLPKNPVPPTNPDFPDSIPIVHCSGESSQDPFPFPDLNEPAPRDDGLPQIPPKPAMFLHERLPDLKTMTDEQRVEFWRQYAQFMRRNEIMELWRYRMWERIGENELRLWRSREV
ncbi:hypothetical protein SLE2022_349550 [Rubroshorea leprosula]|uniref:Cytochrome c oxidase subunit 2 n=4 Tax=Pentapetalae TaxID=1437201 RepID=A0AAV5MTA0_9ROSI|nr:hypothetical protein SLEP1_g58798 [Rubroshorea leprosula]